MLSVYDAASGAKIAGPVDRAQFGATAWSDDSKTIYFIRLQQLAKGEDPVDFGVEVLQNGRTFATAVVTASQAGRTCALITPDQALARRICAKLSRWDIAVNKSGRSRLPK